MKFLVEKSAKKVKEGGVLEQVETLQLDTGSFCPRSNRRKIRAFLVRFCDVKPNMVKQAMKDLDWQTPPRRIRKELKEWIRKQGDVEDRDLNHATMMIKHYPGSMLGVVDGKDRRRVQQEYDDMLAQERIDAEKREADLTADMAKQAELDKNNSWELQDVTTE